MLPPRLIDNKPSISNFETISQYQASTPAEYSLEEYPVLYGGATNLAFTALGDVRFHPALQAGAPAVIDLFVSNVSVIFWFNAVNHGIELPYQNLVLHALQTPQSIYMQLKPSHLLDIVDENDEEYERTIECLIELRADTNANIASNQLWTALYANSDASQVIASIFSALSRCSSMHVDSDDEEGDVMEDASASELTVGDMPALELVLGDHGDADDLSDREGEIENGTNPAGVLVDVGAGPLAGSVRTRDEVEMEEGSPEETFKRVC